MMAVGLSGAVLLTLFLVGCAARLPPPAPPPNARPLRLGVTGSYHGPLDAATLAHLNSYRQPIILRAAVTSADQAAAILRAVQPYPGIQILWLVEADNGPLLEALNPIVSAADRPNPTYGIELGNELDLAGMTPVDFGSWVITAASALRANGFHGVIISGSTYSVQPETLAWLRASGLYYWPRDVVVGLHRYGDPDAGQKGYASRLEETEAITNIGRAVAITEFGYPQHTADDEAWAATAAARDVAWFRAAGATVAIWYQITDGPGTLDLDRYGLHTLDGRWRAVERMFQ